MSNDENRIFQQRLIQEIKELERRIQELKQEKATAQRMLMRARRVGAIAKEVGRKNSVARALIEGAITDELRRRGRPLTSDELYKVAQTVNRDIKQNTFRSQLHRAKERAIIKNHNNQNGLWILVDDGLAN